nr:hypothetical protein [uncultured Prevotella sp.]
MTRLEELATAYAKKHGGGSALVEAYKTGYFQCTDNWCNKAK